MRRAAVAVALLLGACTSSGGPPPVTHRSVTPSGGPASALAEMGKLCIRPPLRVQKATASKNVPAVVASTEHEVEAVRGIRYEHAVSVEALSRSQMLHSLGNGFEHSFPAGLMRRRGLAWQTVGAIPRGTDLLRAYQNYFSGQVLGYYDPASKRLVYIGTNSPSPAERFILAHELTHALDDQHFNLVRTNGIENRCQDENLQAATGVIEGSAVYFSSQVVYRFFTQRDQSQVFNRGGSYTPPPVPQFLQSLVTWPYIAGPKFIAAMEQRGGTAAVNRAIRHFPVSTEQVIHPSAYPNDLPTPVEVPELAQKLGHGWHDLDVQQVGEEWLSALLALHLDATEWQPAAAGWSGGLYRAWADGKHVAVVMTTVWDSPNDAAQFEHALTDWLRPGQPASFLVSRDRVTVLFASDRSTMRKLQGAEQMNI